MKEELLVLELDPRISWQLRNAVLAEVRSYTNFDGLPADQQQTNIQAVEDMIRVFSRMIPGRSTQDIASILNATCDLIFGTMQIKWNAKKKLAEIEKLLQS